ncbi:hypothetical protein [Glycomyces arizonensis]|nr:hypothetical protein [Glycomyces arizonensis]
MAAVINAADAAMSGLCGGRSSRQSTKLARRLPSQEPPLIDLRGNA